MDYSKEPSGDEATRPVLTPGGYNLFPSLPCIRYVGTAISCAMGKEWVAVGLAHGQIAMFRASRGQTMRMCSQTREPIAALALNEDRQEIYAICGDRIMVAKWHPVGPLHHEGSLRAWTVGTQPVGLETIHALAGGAVAIGRAGLNYFAEVLRSDANGQSATTVTLSNELTHKTLAYAVAGTTFHCLKNDGLHCIDLARVGIDVSPGTGSGLAPPPGKHWQLAVNVAPSQLHVVGDLVYVTEAYPEAVRIGTYYMLEEAGTRTLLPIHSHTQAHGGKTHSNLFHLGVDAATSTVIWSQKFPVVGETLAQLFARPAEYCGSIQHFDTGSGKPLGREETVAIAPASTKLHPRLWAGVLGDGQTALIANLNLHQQLCLFLGALPQVNPTKPPFTGWSQGI